MWELVIIYLITLFAYYCWNLRAANFPPEPKMEIEVVTLLKVPVKVVCYGGVTPSRLIKDPTSKPKELILIITGNPGVTSFYYRFASRLHEKTKLPLWIVSHGGHEVLPVPPLKTHKELYTLQGQTRQKQELIETYLKGIKLRCVAHSIGSKMVLGLLQTPFESQIESAYLLFPTIERMAVSENGRKIIFVNNYLVWSIMLLTSVFQLFPRYIQYLIARIYCIIVSATSDNHQAVVDLLEPRSLKKVLFLADDEMKTVLERDDDLIKKNVHRIRFYYGATDGWAPVEYYKDLVKCIPKVQAQVDDNGILHSFVLRSGAEVADITARMIASDTANNKINNN